MKTVKCHCRRGLSMIGLIIAIVLMALLLTGLVMLLNTGVLETVEATDASFSLLAAETGLSAAKAYVATNILWYTNVPHALTGAIGNATFVAGITATNPPLAEVTSVGRRGNSRWTTIWRGTAPAVPALAVYSEAATNASRYRIYYGRYGRNRNVLSDELSAQAIVNVPQWQRIAAHPKTNAFILVAQDSMGWIWAQTWAQGRWSTNVLLNGAGQAPTVTARGFDVAYEGLSGRAMVAYSIGTVTPQYRLWDGTNWTAPVGIDVGANDVVWWVRLVPRPNSNTNLLLVRSQHSAALYKSAAILWNGSSWNDLQQLEVKCSSRIDVDTMDGAFLKDSVVVLYINGLGSNRNAPKYRIFDSGGWGNERAMAKLGDIPCWIRVQAAPDGTNAYAAFLYNENNGNDYLQGALWNGNSWGAYDAFQGTPLQTSGTRDFDMAWSSQSNLLMVTYGALNSLMHSHMTRTPSTAAVYGNMATGTSYGAWSVLRPDPYSGEFMYLAQDASNCVNIQRWNGSRWIWLKQAEIASGAGYNGIDMAFRRDAP